MAKAARDLEKQEKAATQDLARQEKLDVAATRPEKIAAVEARCRPALTANLSEDEDSKRGCTSLGVAI